MWLLEVLLPVQRRLSRLVHAGGGAQRQRPGQQTNRLVLADARTRLACVRVATYLPLRAADAGCCTFLVGFGSAVFMNRCCNEQSESRSDRQFWAERWAAQQRRQEDWLRQQRARAQPPPTVDDAPSNNYNFDEADVAASAGAYADGDAFDAADA